VRAAVYIVLKKRITIKKNKVDFGFSSSFVVFSVASVLFRMNFSVSGNTNEAIDHFVTQFDLFEHNNNKIAGTHFDSSFQSGGRRPLPLFLPFTIKAPDV